MKLKFLVAVWVLAVAWAGSAAETFVSGFETNLDANVGDGYWEVQAAMISTDYTTNGATEGMYALEMNHPVEWNLVLRLNGNSGNGLVQEVVNSDSFDIDVTVPTNAAWGEMILVTQGGTSTDGSYFWSQAGLPLIVSTTQTLSFDLQALGLAAGAEAILADTAREWDWFSIYIATQGENLDTNDTVVTTIIDNIRFSRTLADPFPIVDVQPAGTGVALTWESLANAKYDVMFADDLALGNWTQLVEGVAGLAGTTTATGALQGATAAYRVAWKPLFSDDFEGTDLWTQGYDADPDTVWERGAPSVPAGDYNGPTAAYSGTNCWATDLGGYYINNVDSWLRSPVIDLAGVTAASLSFRQFRDVEGEYDYGYVHVLDEGGTPLYTNLVVESPIDFDDDWVKHTVNLPAEALDTNIVLEFRFTTSDDFNSFDYAGWYIDDVAITGD